MLLEATIRSLGGLGELPFTSEDDPQMRVLLSKAILAVECENSLWRAERMPSFGVALSPQRRTGGKPGLPKAAVVPTVILKQEDREPLKTWEAQRGVPIHIWHVFFEMAFGISLGDAEAVIT
jgi:hypothetical protein